MGSYFETVNRIFRDDAVPALAEYVSIRCLSPSFQADWSDLGEIDRAVELIDAWARQRKIPGLSTRVSRIPNRTPALVVTIPGTQTTSGSVLLYGHLDKQPASAPWPIAGDPFVATFVGDLIYGRGVADDGYSCFAALSAIEALASLGVPYPRCTVVIEASEESGSPDLDAHLDALAAEIADTSVVICLDSGGLDFERLWVTTSLRGNLVINVDVKVLDHGVHSGSAGGVVPSSFRILRSLLARIEDATTGEILPQFLRAEIPELHLNRAKMLDQELGDPLSRVFPTVENLELMGSSGSERILNQTWRASLAVIGIEGIPDIQNAGNVLRSHTVAKLSLRIPPNVDAQLAQKELIDLMKADPPSAASVTVAGEGSAPAQGWVAADLTEPIAEALDVASLEIFGKPAGFCGEGGSIPFLAALGARFPEAQVIATGALGPGSNHHGPDESLRLTSAVAVSVAVAHILSVSI